MGLACLGDFFLGAGLAGLVGDRIFGFGAGMLFTFNCIALGMESTLLHPNVDIWFLIHRSS